MEVKYIYFDNDLDIAPGPDESFTYKPGDDFIMHWNTSTPPPEGYPYKHILLRMYNVRFVREIDFANHTPVPHSNSSINQGPVPEVVTHPTNPVAPCTTEPWLTPSPDDNVQENGEPNPTAFDPPPLQPKLNEICICEDVPDPYCPLHRNRGNI